MTFPTTICRRFHNSQTPHTFQRKKIPLLMVALNFDSPSKGRPEKKQGTTHCTTYSLIRWIKLSIMPSAVSTIPLTSNPCKITMECPASTFTRAVQKLFTHGIHNLTLGSGAESRTTTHFRKVPQTQGTVYGAINFLSLPKKSSSLDVSS